MTPLDQRLEALAAQLKQRKRLQKRLRLLEALDATGSLTAAADITGVCYKTAWNHLRELTCRAECPLVTTVSGGSRGGGSTLTERGRQLLALLRIHGTDSPLPENDRTPTLRFSARNQLAGRITDIELQGPIATVDIDVRGVRIRSRITRSSIDNLSIQVGREIYAIIKATVIKLWPPERAPDEANANCLHARILACPDGANGGEIRLQLAKGVELTTVRQHTPRDERWLYPGAGVQVVFDPLDIMLATAT